MDLKNWYRDQLKDKIIILEEEKTIYSIDRERSIESIRLTIHSLKGSGGTFGFNEITEKAKYMEELPDYDLIDQIDDFINILIDISEGKDLAKISVKKSVLFIDDDSDLVHLMNITFEKYDVVLYTASNFKDAKRLLEDIPTIHYIIHDMVMPDIDGKDLLKYIKSIEKFKFVPVTVLSGNDDKELINKCLSLGAENFIKKPFNATHIALDIVNKLNNKSISPQYGNLLPKQYVEETYNKIIESSIDKGLVSSMALVNIGFFQLLIDKYGESMRTKIIDVLVEKLSTIKSTKDSIINWDSGELIFLFFDTSLTNSYELLKITLNEFASIEFFPENSESFYATYYASLIELKPDMSFTVAISKTEKLLDIAKNERSNQIIYDDSLVKSGETIVLVDDDSLILSILTHKFEKSGYSIKSFDDGEQALAYLKKNSNISLIITDIKMPAMDGYQLLEIIRDLPSLLKVPVMMVSSVTSEDDIIKAMNLDADDFVKKPFSPDELVARANRMIKRSKIYNA